MKNLMRAGMLMLVFGSVALAQMSGGMGDPPGVGGKAEADAAKANAVLKLADALVEYNAALAKGGTNGTKRSEEWTRRTEVWGNLSTATQNYVAACEGLSTTYTGQAETFVSDSDLNQIVGDAYWNIANTFYADGAYADAITNYGHASTYYLLGKMKATSAIGKYNDSMAEIAVAMGLME